jgi:hypothetical protein
VEAAFSAVKAEIESKTHPGMSSNDVLKLVRPGLIALGFEVEGGSRIVDRIRVPVLFGANGRIDKAFDADAWHREEGVVVEVEAGRGVTNYQFLKDLFEACMMHGVKYLVIAVRNLYRRNDDWKVVTTFFDTMYASQRLKLPLAGILAIGY